MITGQEHSLECSVRLKSIGFIGGLRNKDVDDNKANIFYQANRKNELSKDGKHSHFRKSNDAC